MIEVKNICKSFDGLQLFKNFNVTVESGEFVVFSGASGCGKTTLLNIIGAIECIDSGTVTIDGIDITKKKNQLNYFRTKVGFLFQNFALVENKTVSENLKLILNASRNNVTIEQALEEVGLTDKINEKVYKLSGGEQQRVALARLLIKKCDIILADEPTGSLDKGNANKVMALIQKLNDNGKTIILVTHDEQIKKLGSRVIELPARSE